MALGIESSKGKIISSPEFYIQPHQEVVGTLKILANVQTSEGAFSGSYCVVCSHQKEGVNLKRLGRRDKGH